MIRKIYLYDEGVAGFYFKGIKDFITAYFGKIPVQYVKLKEKVIKARGLLFDFIGTEGALSRLNSAKERDACHIILTQKLFATFDDDKRLHIRASIYGFPSVISTSGIVEGPAKPKEYYLYKQRYSRLGAWELEGPKIKKRFKGRFIDYRDKRMNEVLKGYISQALFFYIFGSPFCAKRNCRLYNAHWQKDLIYSQVKSAGFCAQHKKLLRKIKDKYAILIN